jgi:hypothetical protein
LASATTTYIALLDNTAKDPKTVPVGDKSVYVAASNKLKAELEDTKEEGAKLETALEGAEKKDKVNPAILKECNDFIALRQNAAVEAGKMLVQMKGFLTQITQSAAGAAKQLEEAKKAAKESNLMGHQVAVGGHRPVHRTGREDRRYGGKAIPGKHRWQERSYAMPNGQFGL